VGGFFSDSEAVRTEPRRAAQARGVLETMIQLIDDQRDAWAVAEDVAGFIGTSQAMLWRELVIEDIEDGSKARSRRFEVLRRLHAVDATRGHQTMILRPFGPRRATSTESPRNRLKIQRETTHRHHSRTRPQNSAQAQLKKLSGLKKTVKKTGLYIDVSKNIKNFINTIPLIAALRSPSMRPRHWELLRKATGKEFVPPHEDEDLQLGGLLSLNLHEFNTDVEEICDQATKEEKIEARAPRPLGWSLCRV
jgi:hypothetical protein